MAQIWLISDTHFGHANMYGFLREDGTRVRREFASAREGDEYMLQKWAEMVKPEDHIYHLGDVALSRMCLERVKGLPGHKRLVLGNHDRESLGAYQAVGFQKIFGSRNCERLLLSHYPLHPGSIGKAMANVHGHIHYHDSPPGRYINVSVERIGYQPVPIEDVIEQAKRLKEQHDTQD